MSVEQGQHELAAEIGIDTGTLNRMELGKGSPDSVSFVKILMWLAQPVSGSKKTTRRLVGAA